MAIELICSIGGVPCHTFTDLTEQHAFALSQCLRTHSSKEIEWTPDPPYRWNGTGTRLIEITGLGE